MRLDYRFVTSKIGDRCILIFTAFLFNLAFPGTKTRKDTKMRLLSMDCSTLKHQSSTRCSMMCQLPLLYVDGSLQL